MNSSIDIKEKQSYRYGKQTCILGVGGKDKLGYWD